MVHHFLYSSLQCGCLLCRTTLCTAAYSVPFCYDETLSLLQLTVWQFGRANHFIYYNLHCGRLLSEPLSLLQLTLFLFGIANHFVYLTLQYGSLV
jgi:hypothetical protein